MRTYSHNYKEQSQKHRRLSMKRERFSSNSLSALSYGTRYSVMVSMFLCMVTHNNENLLLMFHSQILHIAVTMAFCFFFVSIFSILFGNENSIVGVVVLLCLMVFRNADLGDRKSTRLNSSHT